MESRSDYQLELNIGIPVVADNHDLRQKLVDVWADALESLGIRFLLALTRFQTLHAGKADEYQQLLYGVSSTETPSAEALRNALSESLANHGLGGLRVGVDVYRMERQLVDTSRSAEQADQFRKGVLAA